jgi:hypothetical protein
MNEDKYPVVKTLILDIMSAAISIEESFSGFLAPPKPGAYLPGQMEPILKPDENYFLYQSVNAEPWNVGYGLYQRRYRSTETGAPIGHMKEHVHRHGQFNLPSYEKLERVTYEQAAEWNKGVMDESGKILVSDLQAQRLSLKPTVPVTALLIVRDWVENYVRSFRAWEKDNRLVLEDHIIAQYLSKDITWFGEVEKGENLYQVWRSHQGGQAFMKEDLINDIGAHLRALRLEIAQFIGGDEWRVHFLRYHGPRAVALIKSEDYRIVVYNEKTASGEW